MIILQNLTYTYPNKDVLFDGIHLVVNSGQKVALIGNNGTGKSTLLNIIAGNLQPASGSVQVAAKPYHIPQIFGQYNHLTIAEALGVQEKLTALRKILDGEVTEENLTLLADDWTLEEKCASALSHWQLQDLSLDQRLATLSGGQKTKVYLAGVSMHEPDLVLMDEPSNHLDIAGRELLYDFIQNTPRSLVVVSHDRKLLKFLGTTCEISKKGITCYGGNYDFYSDLKIVETEALSQDIQSKEKSLKKAREKERETIERQQKLDSRGKKKQENAGVARIMMNTLRNAAENSTAKLRSVHTGKTNDIAKELQELRANLSDFDKMRFSFDNASLHKGKLLFEATDLNHHYQKDLLWKENLSFRITSGERLAIQGLNGSGKTTLIRMILGLLEPTIGTAHQHHHGAVYVDQDYSLIDDRLTVLEQANGFNSSALQEHEIKIRLNRFLFSKNDWNKPCKNLSGGERMRLILCCLNIGSKSPDLIILDEPTNNLDIQNVEILTGVINDYEGTLIVVSHDETFLNQTHIQRFIRLK